MHIVNPDSKILIIKMHYGNASLCDISLYVLPYIAKRKPVKSNEQLNLNISKISSLITELKEENFCK